MLVNSKHFVSERLHYVPRNELAASVVEQFVVRQKKRVTSSAGGGDKADNPLITLPATQGSGKSTFLVHFPNSPEYTTYALRDGDVAPVVALVTFNSGQEGGAQGLGLRIAYGCLVSMGYVVHTTQTWRQFSTAHEYAKNLTGEDVVNVLRRILGEKRRFIICVDEVAKAFDPGAVVQQVGALLNNDGRTDVLVSALTPHMIRSLESISGRQIIYQPVSPLLALWQCFEYGTPAKAMIDEARVALMASLARRSCSDRGKQSTIAGFNYKCRLVASAALLASGHPRTVERLVDSITFTPEEWIQVKGALSDSLVTAGSMLHLLGTMPCFAEFFKMVETEEELGYLLSTHAFDPSENPPLRAMLESNKCSIYSMSGARCRVTSNLSGLFRLVEQCRALADPGHKGKLLVDSFGRIDNDDLSGLWERARALTLALRACELWKESGSDQNYVKLSYLFGVTAIKGRAARQLTIHNEWPANAREWTKDAIVLQGDNQIGYDLVLCGYTEAGKPAIYCEEVKIGMGKTDLLTMLAKKIKSTTTDWCGSNQTTVTGDGVHFIFSRFADPTETEVIALHNNKALLEKMTALMEEAKLSNKGKDEIKAWKRAMWFVRTYYETNIAVLHKRDLAETMPPVLLPLATLVEHTSGDANIA